MSNERQLNDVALITIQREGDQGRLKSETRYTFQHDSQNGSRIVEELETFRDTGISAGVVHRTVPPDEYSRLNAEYCEDVVTLGHRGSRIPQGLYDALLTESPDAIHEYLSDKPVREIDGHLRLDADVLAQHDAEQPEEVAAASAKLFAKYGKHEPQLGTCPEGDYMAPAEFAEFAENSVYIKIFSDDPFVDRRRPVPDFEEGGYGASPEDEAYLNSVVPDDKVPPESEPDDAWLRDHVALISLHTDVSPSFQSNTRYAFNVATNTLYAEGEAIQDGKMTMQTHEVAPSEYADVYGRCCQDVMAGTRSTPIPQGLHDALLTGNPRALYDYLQDKPKVFDDRGHAMLDAEACYEHDVAHPEEVAAASAKLFEKYGKQEPSHDEAMTLAEYAEAAKGSVQIDKTPAKATESKSNRFSRGVNMGAPELQTGMEQEGASYE